MDFQAFPKIPRLFRDMVVTEKIDGTNAAVVIEELGVAADSLTQARLSVTDVLHDGKVYRVGAQSRKRMIIPESDNFGFARWVREHQEELVRLLGPGRHFGEWWGSGIQRGYDQTGKRFSLFNPEFHFGDPATSGPDGGPSELLHNVVDVVPVLYRGLFSTLAIRNSVGMLRAFGSQAAPGYKNPEGVIVWHEAAQQTFKVTLKNDETPKSASIHWGGDGA